MSNSNKISVIIPTFNRANTLVKAIESVLAQTIAVNEIIVCDDGSTDDSKQRVLALNCPNVFWVDCGRNGRPAIPRNIGIQKASSPWIAFLDSDDEWEPEKLEIQLKLAEKNNGSAICTNGLVVGNSTAVKIYHEIMNEEVFSFSKLLTQNMVICSSVLVKKELIVKAGLFNTSVMFTAIEDYDLWLKISLFEPFLYSPKPLVKYKDDATQSIRQKNSNGIEQMKLIFGDVFYWIKQKQVTVSKTDLEKLRGRYLHYFRESDTSLFKFNTFKKRLNF